jgi:surfeit locus 1 family protein
MMRSARALLAPGVATALACAFLVALGFWQLRRLDQKEALIARIEARIGAPVAAIPLRADWAKLLPTDYDFRHVQVAGRYLPGREAFVFSPPPEGGGREPGYIVVTPFALETGETLLVERGFIPGSGRDAAQDYRPPDGRVAVTGFLHAPQTRNLFTPTDDPARGVWYTRDPAAIAAALGIANAAPFTLARAPEAGAEAAFPRPFPGAPQLANNHLAYAFTWFSLAGAVVVIFALFARARLRRSAGNGAD